MSSLIVFANRFSATGICLSHVRHSIYLAVKSRPNQTLSYRTRSHSLCECYPKPQKSRSGSDTHITMGCIHATESNLIKNKAGWDSHRWKSMKLIGHNGTRTRGTGNTGVPILFRMYDLLLVDLHYELTNFYADQSQQFSDSTRDRGLRLDDAQSA